MAFSATDAAFEGFRLVRRNPMAMVAWALLYAVLSLTALFAMSTAIDPLIAWSEMAEAMEAGSPTPEEVGQLFQAFGAVLLRVVWLAPLGLLVSAMLYAAVARGVLEPGARSFGYLRLGMDEWRVLVVSLVLSILMGLLCFVVMVLIGLIAGVSAASGANWGWLVGLLAGLAGLALIVWLAVRLSLAVPITVAEKRMAFFDSFAMTRGRFWPLFGMAIIALVMTLIIGLLASIVTMPLAMMSGLESWNFGAHSDPEIIRAALDVSNPWVIASAVVDAIVSALTVGVLYAPFAAAYLGLKSTPTA